MPGESKGEKKNYTRQEIWRSNTESQKAIDEKKKKKHFQKGQKTITSELSKGVSKSKYKAKGNLYIQLGTKEEDEH